MTERYIKGYEDGCKEERQRILKLIEMIDFKVRIQSEFDKYAKYDMDWIKIAELKLKGEINMKIRRGDVNE